MIEFEKRKFITAAVDVTFSIRQGETLALVGESGSGKSTVARMVAGLLPPTRGTVTIDGINLWAADNSPRDLRRVRRRLQMIFQDPYASLNPRWRVRDIIADPIKALDVARGRSEIDNRVVDLLRLVGLDPADASKYPHEFSGGQRQRIAIARALSSEPEFIICDEPTSALDVSVQAQILNLMRDLQQRLGLAYLFISHNLAVVRQMATQIAVMYLGRIAEMTETAALFDRPRHPYTRMLMEAIPDLSGAGRPRKAVAGGIPDPTNLPPGCSFHPRCPFAFDPCRVEVPPLAMEGSVAVACHAVVSGRI
jgi:peptide/nickel transport system ATP-binding protein